MWWVFISELDDLSVRQVFYQSQVCFEEVEIRQVLAVGPLHIFKNAVLDLAFVFVNDVKPQFHRASTFVVVLDAGDLFADSGVYSKLLIQFSPQGISGLLTGFDLAPGKLPFQRHDLMSGTLADQDLAVLDD